MVLSNKKSWKLSEKDKSFILNNYKNYNQKELAGMFGVTQPCISKLLIQNGKKYRGHFKKSENHPSKLFVKGIPKKQVYDLMMKYDGKITISEMGEIIKSYLGISLGRTTINRYAKNIGFKSYKNHSKKECEKRLFLNGDESDLRQDNIIIIKNKTYNFLRNEYEKNLHTGELLKTLIMIADLNLMASKLEDNGETFDD